MSWPHTDYFRGFAEIHGDLGDLIEIAIREHGLNFEIAENH